MIAESLVSLRLFRHRKRELLLRPFSDEGAPPFSWVEVHEGYRFAQSRGLLHENLPLERNHSPGTAEATLEREYMHALIQDLMEWRKFLTRKRVLGESPHSALVHGHGADAR